MNDFRDGRRHHGVENGWIAVGAFAGAHGVRGDVRLKSFTEDPDAIFAYAALHQGAGGPVVRLKKLRADKEGFIVRIGGVADREAAMALKGKQLFVERASLAEEDEDEYYLADLIGLEARDAAGGKIGTVVSVENFGSEDLLELVLDAPVAGLGRYAFVPFRKALVPTVDIAGGFVTIAFSDWLETQTSERGEEESEEAAK
ncbi:ribosome maturation factor RimM [Kordiimonas marina]|uniref:ribosome maturation factor RimM n=1 Tax=Kordiimonas marina TaxID=2872312 RepID=UPI001FF6D8EC|nr:ribosome maturation factor RimM [Kordiimonas marina]MCJ9430721.1 ribosome maturation factor RimM [Kordiimonas marina]